MEKPNFQPKSFSGIVDAAFKMYSQDFVSLIKLSLIFNLPLLLMQMVMQTTDANQSPAIVFGAAILMIVLSLVCSSMLTGATMQIVSARYLGEKISFTEAMGRTTAILGKVISTSMLVGIWIFLGFLMLIIPGIFWIFTLALALPAVVLEGKSGSEALARSKELVKHNRGKVVGTVIGIGLIVGLLGAVFGGLWQGGLAVASVDGTGLFAQAGESLLSFLIAPINNVALVILYYDLRIRYEGYDLELLSKEMA